jgi:hypothetical protein
MHEETGSRQKRGKRHPKLTGGLAQGLYYTLGRIRRQAWRLAGVNVAKRVNDTDVGESTADVDADAKRVLRDNHRCLPHFDVSRIKYRLSSRFAGFWLGAPQAGN